MPYPLKNVTLSSNNDDWSNLVEFVNFLDSFVDTICAFALDENISVKNDGCKKLGDRLGIKPRRLKKILEGDTSLTCSEMCCILNRMGRSIKIERK